MKILQCALLAAGLCVSGVVWAQERSFDVPASDAVHAIPEFARQAGLQIVAPADELKGIRTPAIKGNLDARAALKHLLEGTGLEIASDDGAIITLRNISRGGGKSKGSVTASAIVEPRSASSESELGTHLEEVIVTARRREENAQQVPVAVTVLSQGTLLANNVQTIQDLQYLVPSLSLSNNAPNQVGLSLRGQGVRGVQAGVTMFLNEVPLATINGGVQNNGPGLFFDLENVQVLRGPQGTLFGKNSVGGDILLQTARPTNEFSGRVQATYGNYNDQEIDGVVNFPIVKDVLLARIAYNGQLRDGYSHILAEPSHPNGIDADNRSNWAVRGTMTFRPSEVFQNDTILADSKFSSRGMFGVLVEQNPAVWSSFLPFFPSVANLPSYLAQQQPLGIRTSIPLDVDDVANGGSLVLSNITRVTLSRNLTLRNIFGYDREETILQADQDNTLLLLFDAPSNPSATVARQWTEELQLLGKSLHERLDWIAGAFFMDQPIPNDFVLQAYNVLSFPGYSLFRRARSSKAVYTHGIYDLSSIAPHVKITAGVRYTKDDIREEDRNGGGVCSGAVQDCAAAAIATEVDNRARSNALTWTIGLDYQATPNTLLYVTSRRGYRPGGFNFGAPGATSPPSYGPEFVTDGEIGVKSDWKLAHVPIRTNADVWYQAYSDIQEPELLAISIAPLTQNAGRARLWGAELEALAQLTDNFQLGINFDHSYLQYTQFNPGVPASVITSLEATRTLNNPPNKYGLSARYHLPLAGNVGSVSMRADWNWQASGGDATFNSLGVIQSFGLLNVSADWKGMYGTAFDLSLFASNLLNKDYVINAVPTFEPTLLGYGSAIYGVPRMYGMRVRYRFGADAR